MISTVIIEDEPKNMRLLQNLISEFCPVINIIGIADNAKSGELLIRETNPELVFMDIEMPFGNGFEVLNKLMPISFEVIFVTAFDKYMIQAFKYCVIDYLLKPISIEHLKNAVKNAENRIQKNNLNLQIVTLLNNLKSENPQFRKIGIPGRNGYEFIKLTDIVRCEARGSYTIVFLLGGNKFIVSKSLKEYESLFPVELFFRIHNTHLVNLSYIKKYNRGRGGYVEMEDGSLLEVAVRRKDEFLEKFGLKS